MCTSLLTFELSNMPTRGVSVYEWVHLPNTIWPFALRSAPHTSFLPLRTRVGVKLHFPSSPAFRLRLSLSFPSGAVGKNPPANGRSYTFSPWVGKIPWGRKWQPTPVFSPIKFHGQRSLVGYSSRGCKKSDTIEHTHEPASPGASHFVNWNISSFAGNSYPMLIWQGL